MSLISNLQLAKDTNLHVRALLIFGSNNRESDKANAEKFAAANLRIATINRNLHDDAEEYELVRSHIGVPYKHYHLTQRAIHATAQQAGNCVDHAAVGFMQLIKNPEVRPLAIAQVKRGDVIPHTLIIIGDPEGLDAVVCDPYEDEAYPLEEFCHSRSYVAGDTLWIDISIDGQNKFAYSQRSVPQASSQQERSPLAQLSLLAAPHLRPPLLQ